MLAFVHVDDFCEHRARVVNHLWINECAGMVEQRATRWQGILQKPDRSPRGIDLRGTHIDDGFQTQHNGSYTPRDDMQEEKSGVATTTQSCSRSSSISPRIIVTRPSEAVLAEKSTVSGKRRSHPLAVVLVQNHNPSLCIHSTTSDDDAFATSHSLAVSPLRVRFSGTGRSEGNGVADERTVS